MIGRRFRIFGLIVSGLFCSFNGYASDNAAGTEAKALIDDFSQKFSLYWVDGNFVIHRDDQQLPTTTIDNYSREILLVDGSYVESDFIIGRPGGNGIGLSYLGKKYESYDGEFLADGASLYYQKCLQEKFSAAKNENICVIFGLFRGQQEVDRVDYNSQIGSPAFKLNFDRQGLLYYEKPVGGDNTQTLVFDPSQRKSTPFRSDIFDPRFSNELVGILPDESLLYENYSGNLEASNFDVKLYRLNRSSKKSELILDLGNAIDAAGDGVVIGDHYYFRTGLGPTSLIRDDIKIAQFNSKTRGRIIDASKVACSLDATINTYRTKMICIHPSGAVVWIDSANAENGKQFGGADHADLRPELFVDNRPLDLNSIRYLLADQSSEKSLQQISLAFDDAGQVEFALFWVHGDSPWKDSIFVSRYKKDTGLSVPILLKDNAQLFGVISKQR